MIISCEKASKICNKAQYNEASSWERIKLNFHLFICKTCAAHSKKNGTLTSLCSQANLSALSEEDKQKMKESFAKSE